MDGVEATRRILRERQVPIVALTGHRTGGYIERAIEAGAVAHVLKPFHEANLVGTIAGALADHASESETRWALADHASESEARWALADEDTYNQRVLIESMVRRNSSEREIVAALRGGYSWDDEFAAVGEFVRRIVTFFKR